MPNNRLLFRLADISCIRPVDFCHIFNGLSGTELRGRSYAFTVVVGLMNLSREGRSPITTRG